MVRVPSASGLDEFARIRRYLSPLAGKVPGAWNLTDDAAWIGSTDEQGWLIAADAIVAGVHFLPDDHPGDIARRLLRVNLSDMAAMGAWPQLYFMTLALPPGYDETWLAGFTAGLKADQQRFTVDLAGGDCVTTEGPAVFSLTMLGRPSGTSPLRRAGARPGDHLVVSGQLGDAALALHLRQAGFEVPADDDAFFEARRLAPEPRIGLGAALTDLAHAAIDISDGLVADLRHLCRESGVGADVWAARIPLSDPARRALNADPGLLEIILTGGDDYELLFACGPDDWPTIRDHAAHSDVPVTRIGVFRSDQEIVVMDLAGRPMVLGHGGYRHV